MRATPIDEHIDAWKRGEVQGKMDGNAERDIDVAGARSLSQGLQERVQVRPRDLESSVQRSRPGISAGRPRCSTKWPTSTNIENFLIPRQRHPRFVTFVTPPSRQRSASKLRSIRLISAAMRDRDEPTPWGSSATATGEREKRRAWAGKDLKEKKMKNAARGRSF